MTNSSFRLAPVRIATDLGWMRGHITLQADGDVLQSLNAHVTLIRLSDVVVPSRRERLDFLAVRCKSVSLVLPDQADDAGGRVWSARSGSQSRLRRVLVMLAKVSVVGELSMLNHARVSDVFDSGQSFFRLRNASVYTDNDSGQSNLLDTFAEVLVNIEKIHGISDLGGPAKASPSRATPAGPASLAAIRRQRRHMPSNP